MSRDNSREAWNKDTGKEVIKVAAQGIVVCGALAVFALTLGVVGPHLSPS